MTFDLTKSREQQPAPAGYLVHDDIHCMVLLWQHECTRNAALELADRNRSKANPSSKDNTNG